MSRLLRCIEFTTKISEIFDGVDPAKVQQILEIFDKLKGLPMDKVERVCSFDINISDLFRIFPKEDQEKERKNVIEIYNILSILPQDKARKIMKEFKKLIYLTTEERNSVAEIVISREKTEAKKRENLEKLFDDQLDNLIKNNVPDAIGVASEWLRELISIALKPKIHKIEGLQLQDEIPFVIIIPQEMITITKWLSLIDNHIKNRGMRCRFKSSSDLYIQGIIHNIKNIETDHLPYLITHVKVDKKSIGDTPRKHLSSIGDRINQKRAVTAHESMNVVIQYPDLMETFKNLYFLGSSIGNEDRVASLRLDETDGVVIFGTGHRLDYPMKGYSIICSSNIIKIE
ncbi:MAG: hypothetical protein UR85_C0011G0031 [Candidatus Nomurabacteria bacterium GW2011_GWF2_35_66]|nr:MAG: hypothetical protein UR85_C0011G0031 [Candidatus Nomurabacteria bacterium GW2011_GWF2_35_66]HBM45437.1 hypothetical protein [Patescibacteria group bacterium]